METSLKSPIDIFGIYLIPVECLDTCSSKQIQDILDFPCVIMWFSCFYLLKKVLSFPAKAHLAALAGSPRRPATGTGAVGTRATPP